MTQLVILDWDGTVAVPESGATFRKSGERYKWIEGEGLHSSRKELLEHLYYSQNVHIAVATNQGGIAFGIINLTDTKDKIFALLKELDFFVPFLVSPYHEKRPESYQEFESWRKPESGMLRTLSSLFPDVLGDVLVVGDREEDRLAAENAGYEYQDAESFFSALEIDLETFIRDEQTADEKFSGPPTGEVPDFEAIALSAEEDDDGPPF